MNHPYPTSRELRTEAAAERLLAEQAAAEAAFRRVINEARAAIGKLEFPLSSPAYHYDTAGILDLLDELLAGPEADYLEMLADDMARDAMMEAV
jgi:hypothetical protein